MNRGTARLFRWLALFGMGMSTVSFMLAVGDWVSPVDRSSHLDSLVFLRWPSGNQWIGKRYQDVLVQPPQPAPPATFDRLQNFIRGDMKALLDHLQGPSMWLCAAGIMYLMACRVPPRDVEA